MISDDGDVVTNWDLLESISGCHSDKVSLQGDSKSVLSPQEKSLHKSHTVETQTNEEDEDFPLPVKEENMELVVIWRNQLFNNSHESDHDGYSEHNWKIELEKEREKIPPSPLKIPQTKTGKKKKEYGEKAVDETFCKSTDSIVYDETYLGRADIFRPILTPAERKMLGISQIPENMDQSETETEESDQENESPLQVQKEISNSMPLFRPPKPFPKKGGTLLSFLLRRWKNTPVSGIQPDELLPSNSNYFPSNSNLMNKSELKEYRDKLIKTIKWQAKIDNQQPQVDKRQTKESKDLRIRTVQEEYKILKEQLKSKELHYSKITRIFGSKKR